MKKTFAVFVFFFLFCFQAFAEEEITNYHVLIHVQPDASIVVTEVITVNREGKQIRRGIYRDLPRTKGINYQLISVKRDGKDEPHFTENISRTFRINTGNDAFLPGNGLYTFEIKYRAFNAVVPFEDADELYWNVTGNEWSFPINAVMVQVIPPEGAKVTDSSVYIGPQGSKEKGSGRNDIYTSPRQLKPKEGMTIAVGFDKGFVTFPDKPILPDYLIGAASAVLFLYGLITWYRYGRDPHPNAVMPRFDPPEELTAAQAGYVYFYGMKNRLCLSAALIQAAVKGFIEIQGKGSKVRLEKKREPINGEEKQISKKLRFPVTIDDTSVGKLRLFYEDFKKMLKEKSKPYFVRNIRFTLIAGVYIILSLAGMSFLFQQTDAFFFLIMTLPWIYFSIGNLRVVFSKNKKSPGVYFSSAVLLLQSAAFICVAVLMLFSNLKENKEALPLIIYGAGFTVLLPLYCYLMHQPSEKGQRLFEHMDGLKMFMKAVHQDYPKELSFEKMEKLLPYALLFNIEKEWIEKLEKMTDAAVYSPSWYKGRGRFNARCLSGISSSMTSATTSMSSGRRGGGFSGGGGGGGGGGGR